MKREVRLRSVDELYGWLSKAKQGDRAIYHEGFLPYDRIDEKIHALATSVMWLSSASVWIDPRTMRPINGCGFAAPSQVRIGANQWRYLVRLMKTLTPEQVLHAITHCPIDKVPMRA